MIQRRNYDKELMELEQKAIYIELVKRRQTEFAMLKYQRSPELWLEERLGEDPKGVIWSRYLGYESHQWDGSIDPLYNAWLSVAGFHDTAIESATSTGKTWLLARVVLWFLDCFDNPFVITTAPIGDQLKLQLWAEIANCAEKFKLIRPNSKLSTLRLRKDTLDVKFRDTAHAIGIAPGVGAGEESATAFQGKHREHMLIIVDEMPGIHPAIHKAIENTSTGGKNVILAVGNPDNQGDPLHQLTETPLVKSFRISAYDHPNIVLKRELIQGAVSIKSINIRKEKYGENSRFYKSRVRGISPEEGADSVFSMAWLREAQNPDGVIEQDASYNAIGADVANSENGDKACVVYGRANVCEFIKEFQCPNANHLAYNIIYDQYTIMERDWHNFNIPSYKDYEVNEWSIGVDAVGVGAGTINAFHDEQVYAISLHGGQNKEIIPTDHEDKPLYEFKSLRAQMYWEAREDLRQGLVYMRLDPETTRQLNRELLAHTYEPKSGKITISDKDDVKKMLGGKSPNMADAFVYWNHMRKGWYMNNQYTRVSAG